MADRTSKAKEWHGSAARADKPGEAAQDAKLMAKARALGRSIAERLGLDPS